MASFNHALDDYPLPDTLAILAHFLEALGLDLDLSTH